MNDNQKILQDIFTALLQTTGENLQRDGLIDTPKRAALAFKFLTQGYDLNLQAIVNDALFTCAHNNLVIIKDIEFFSVCEHHLLPIVGKCHIGYIPNGKILGLSKLARIVDMFARRLQVQEQLTHQIADAVLTVTNAQGVGVIIDADHLCMMARGVAKQHARTKTAALLGVLNDDIAKKNEFLQLVTN